MVRHRSWFALTAVSAGLCAWVGLRNLVPEAHVFASTKRAPTMSGPYGLARGDEFEKLHAFRVPSGEPPELTCDAARSIVAQVRRNLAYAPEPISRAAFAAATADWLDPYGLWSVAPDSSVKPTIERIADALLLELEGKGRRCEAAREVGRSMSQHVTDVARSFDHAREGAAADNAESAISDSVFESTITRPAHSLAATLGQRVGAFERAWGMVSEPFATNARRRYFPDYDEEQWSRAVLAAAVRAYVPLVDPHGAWAPLDEEASVYEVDLEARPPTRLWDKTSRTALGLRIDSGPQPPFQVGDVILALAGVSTAGLPVEQAEQLGYAISEARGIPRAVVARRGESTPQVLLLSHPHGPSISLSTPFAPEEMPVERIGYGDSDALIVPIRDVRDDLGDALTRAILRERQRDGRPIAGVVLDLRGNGGGSTDGAIEALGIFMPGAQLFPMKRRDGTLESDRAPEPPTIDRWTGPVATLVDADTASAAEMIAGALTSYRRGPSVGTVTFGKGCAQEYLDDEPRMGVLRLTTLLYALPDGAPVQRVGLVPSVRLNWTTGDIGDEREALLPHAPPGWRGPDVRDRRVLAHVDDGTWSVNWPAHHGRIGSCRDNDVCRALRALGGQPAAKRVAKTP